MGSSHKRIRLIEYIKGSYKITSLPFFIKKQINSLTFLPAFDFINNMPSCIISSGISSSSNISNTNTGKTKAIVDLNFDDPTLSFIHNLDERNTISPTISLNNAKIIYNWKLLLSKNNSDSSSSIITRVDPDSSIQITWMDCTPNGSWITDFQIPLKSTSTTTDNNGYVTTNHFKGPLFADIRVRRQFFF